MSQHHSAFDEELAGIEERVVAMAARVAALGRAFETAVRSGDPIDPAWYDAEDDLIDADDDWIATRGPELIARRQPVARDLRFILAMMQVSLHLERIADDVTDATAIAGRADLVPTTLNDEVAALCAMALTVTDTAVKALRDRDVELAREVDRLDAELDGVQAKVFDAIVTALADGTNRRTLLAIDGICRLLRRASEHGVDIAEQVLYLVTGERHELGRSPWSPPT